MKFFDKTGKLVEGTPVTLDQEEVVELFLENINKTDLFNAHSSAVYLSDHEKNTVLRFMLTYCHIRLNDEGRALEGRDLQPPPSTAVSKLEEDPL